MATNRRQRADSAQETIALLKREEYSVAGSVVSLSSELATMRRGTTLYTPAALESLLDSLPPSVTKRTSFSVVNDTTFAAAKSLIADGYADPLCLNFASARNPGGGFLSGSQGQEEYLVRSSGLYQSLSAELSYYEMNRSHASSLYTDHIIYSPSVPVFRDDRAHLLSDPFVVSIITSPAVNAHALSKREPSRVSEIRLTMEKRIRSVLAIARKHGHNSIVLGAWGCGVFGNNPSDIARWFTDALTTDARFANAFDRVVFAVLDLDEGTPTFNAFQSECQRPHKPDPSLW